jgi:hypothetical protein
LSGIAGLGVMLASTLRYPSHNPYTAEIMQWTVERRAFAVKAFYKTATITLALNGYFVGISTQTAVNLCHQLMPSKYGLRNSKKEVGF